MAVFFTADTHFGDHRTINIQRRPFASVMEMDALLIANWNAVVGPDDVIWHLGDVCRRLADLPALLPTLNGTKHLLRGNNDPARSAISRVGPACATMPRSKRQGGGSFSAIIPSEAGTASIAARSTCMGIATGG